MRDKTDSELGALVRRHLIEKGLETDKEFSLKKTSLVSAAWATLDALNVADVGEGSERIANMWENELFYGLDYANFPRIAFDSSLDTEEKNQVIYDEMIATSKIAVRSYCAHHLVPIRGFAAVGYIPDRRVVGLSKINRVVDFFSRRPQIQERLTNQIQEALSLVLGTQDVAVIIRSEHFCITHRGMRDINSVTTTSRLCGQFRNLPVARAELMNLVQKDL